MIPSRIGSILFWLVAFLPVSIHGQSTHRISSLSRSGTLVWTNAQVDHFFTVQAAPVLGTNFTNLNITVISSNTTVSAQVPMTNSSVRFFRVADNGSCCQNNGGPNFGLSLNLGSGCGDQSPVFFNQNGCSNGWFRIRANECSSSTRNLKIIATLTPAAGTDYDLYTYNSDGSVRSSSHLSGTTPDMVTTDVTDTFGTDNSFDLWLEVRRFTGTGCANWSLSIQVGS